MLFGSFERSNQASANLSQRSCKFSESHCSAISRHTSCNRRYSLERIETLHY
jgi:hypothetical protein